MVGGAGFGFERAFLCILLGSGLVLGQSTWCNKNYMKTQPVVPPGGQFPIPATSTAPLLALRCGQAVKPYLPEDTAQHVGDPSFVSILVDTPIVFSKFPGASPVTLPSGSLPSLSVTVTLDGKQLVSGTAPMNSTKTPLTFSLSSIQPRTKAYNLTCTATTGGQKFTTSTLFSFLPAKPSGIGSVTKMDMRTGALLARPANGTSGPYERMFPIGFYTQFDSFLAKNLSAIKVLKDQGFNIIHPVPSFDNMTALGAVLDEMERVGMYLMYDMRGTYMNDTSVTTQVNLIKKRPNLLLWYTADEPDGTSDPLTATLHSKNLINTLDGGDGAGGSGYHPVSLVLNCENYEFTAYSEGADILLQDTYTVGNNLTHSTVWGTACTEDFGDCGCDNCHLGFEDVVDRMEEFYERISINGWALEKTVWAVPQAFGNETYWQRYPTGKEFVVQSILGINHGGLGVVPWDDPTPADIKASASNLALALPKMTPFILDPSAKVCQMTTLAGIDVGLWTVGNQTLVLATNVERTNGTLDLAGSELGLGGNVRIVEVVLESGVVVVNGSVVVQFSDVGSGGFVVGVGQ
ncbi:hypothetical protein E1B28_013736 [Marasmius oreades]|uniref:Glycoside hydrolase family 71 protein n=1 Tax=Marasmius oreades TaxID=181124 RepID=A0A9P7RQF0_9AGAR|nr:uncharacterized protein E1B28_013736 [Marasmius oreades]KAG7087795.1 hypothetical protein E1B28_013736 [Marasmius oreades]